MEINIDLNEIKQEMLEILSRRGIIEGEMELTYQKSHQKISNGGVRYLKLTGLLLLGTLPGSVSFRFSEFAISFDFNDPNE